ncbi:hypothetical protein [Thermodesulfobacterium hveragerdense]|uniref:hypothetical protein n=1 Tax=Thermodesulfobacterium hveragerdense TaxID=53424 RepID=UPI0004275617|nr:hypothetical protein [Thermodesulfobacterium hveragerdense]
MWTALFPNWNSFRFYFFSEEAKEVFNQLKTAPFLAKPNKITPSHLNFLISLESSGKIDFFLKAFVPRFFKKNRVKSYLEVVKSLKKLEVPIIEPLFVFWRSPQVAFLKKETFYGGIVFPYLSQGFLGFKDFLEREGFLEALVRFLFRLHQKGVFIRDTKFNNFYHTNEEGFKIFDLDGLKVYNPPLDKKLRLKDLSALAMTLEWSGMKETTKRIWTVYVSLYSGLTQKDFLFFVKQVEKRRKKREKHFALTRREV